MKKTLTLISLLTASVAMGQTITLWDGNSDYRSGNQAISGPQSVDAPDVGDLSETLGFNGSFPLFAEGPALYGGFTAVLNGSTEEGFGGAMALIHRGGDPADYIRIQNTAALGIATGRFMSALLLSRGEGVPSSLDELSLFAQVRTPFPAGAFHFVIEDGGNFYVSEAMQAPSVDYTDFILAPNLTDDGNWMMHDFSSSIDVDTTGSFTAMEFTNITGIGIYYEVMNVNGDAITADVAVLGLIPEPSTVALISGLLIGGLVWLRRRR